MSINLRKAAEGFVWVCALVFLVQFAVLAAVSITDRTGTIKIIMPDGNVMTIEADEDLPVIPDGATVEIIYGDASVSVTDNSIVNVIVGDSELVLNGSDSVGISYDPASGGGDIECLSGSVVVVSASSQGISTVTLDSTNPSMSLGSELSSGEAPETDIDQALNELEEAESAVQEELDAGDISPSQ